MIQGVGVMGSRVDSYVKTEVRLLPIQQNFGRREISIKSKAL